MQQENVIYDANYDVNEDAENDFDIGPAIEQNEMFLHDIVEDMLNKIFTNQPSSVERIYSTNHNDILQNNDAITDINLGTKGIQRLIKDALVDNYDTISEAACTANGISGVAMLALIGFTIHCIENHNARGIFDIYIILNTTTHRELIDSIVAGLNQLKNKNKIESLLDNFTKIILSNISQNLEQSKLTKLASLPEKHGKSMFELGKKGGTIITDFKKSVSTSNNKYDPVKSNTYGTFNKEAKVVSIIQSKYQQPVAA
jgi:hypothetical protein